METKILDKPAKLLIGDKELDLLSTTGTEGETSIDITKLRDKTGVITMDSGYGNTGSCFSAITFIDGEKGILRYRSEEHTSELQSLRHLVCRLLLEKKKKITN